ncbi:MAG TPA: hypothetical protein VMV72_08475 [Verrucomicrobiae bacterium]|nr:hypothetical protein [Verrucomicrobiae bacterium]
MHLRTVVGVVELSVWYGYDPAAHHWGCPIRQQWALSAHQQLSPGLQDRLAFTVTATGSYEQAAAVAAKWGCLTDDATLHALAQRLGARAEAQTQQRLATTSAEVLPQRAPSALTVLELDGWQVRQRGPGWGRKRTNQPRVEWHELKTAVAYRHDQAGQTAGGRGLLARKLVVSWQGEPLELGRRLHWEALQHGLARSRDTLVVADGAPWIWNVVADRWRGATELLDFYHASQHLWELGRAVSRGDEAQAAAWVELRRHQLRHGAGRLAAGPSSRPVGNANAASSARASSGQPADYGTWARWSKPGPMATGMNSGNPTNGDSVKMHPGGRGGPNQPCLERLPWYGCPSN